MKNVHHYRPKNVYTLIESKIILKYCNEVIVPQIMANIGIPLGTSSVDFRTDNCSMHPCAHPSHNTPPVSVVLNDSCKPPTSLQTSPSSIERRGSSEICSHCIFPAMGALNRK